MKRFILIAALLFVNGCTIHDTTTDSTIVVSKYRVTGQTNNCEFELESTKSNESVWINTPCDYELNVGDSIIVISKQKYRELTTNSFQ